MDVSIFECTRSNQVLDKLSSEFEKRQNILPIERNCPIIIKPNLNSNLDALTGNTTDLRVLGSVIRILKDKGYESIVIAEGPNGGFHRDGVDVFSRNCIDKLARYFGCTFKDVNYETNNVSMEFESSGTVKIAEIFNNNAFFINIPKLKTHYETLVSVALKSLIGILVGQKNKAKAHASLFENILRLNDHFRADLYIVDGLIAMEGTGPSAGRPVRTNLLMVGTDAYEIDIVAALIMGFEPSQCPLLQKAVETNRISQSLIDEIKSVELPVAYKSFERPDPAFLAKFVVMPGLKNTVRKLRNTRVVSSLLKHTTIRRIMFLVGLTQEVIISQERNVKLKFHEKNCTECGKCSCYCPQMLEPPESLQQKESDCINCLYCYAVCPAGAIEAEGQFGYYSEQIRRYGKLVKEIA